ncbi:MAG: tetratricopeptide repeat protein [Campylobacteraceae bacterium]|nr:tetratricopeptide repeat protein [Campylobacteraceae bacterium]
MKIDPNLADIYSNRGVVYGKLGDYSKAIADFTQAIKIKSYICECLQQSRGYIRLIGRL